MYPNAGHAAAFMVDFFDNNKTDPTTWVRGLTFEDISIASVKNLGHFSGPASCIEGLKVHNVTLLDGHGTWGCTGVDPRGLVIGDVAPRLACRGCA